MGLFNIFSRFDDDSTTSSSISEPSVNVDGSPMCGGIDKNGNPYGVTDTDSIGCDSSFDSSSLDGSMRCGLDDW